MCQLDIFFDNKRVSLTQQSGENEKRRVDIFFKNTLRDRRRRLSTFRNYFSSSFYLFESRKMFII